MSELTQAQQISLMKVIGELWDTLFAVGSRPEVVEDRQRGWMSIIEECKRRFNFDPSFDNGWQFLRDNVWKGIRRRAVRRKNGGQPANKVDKEYFALIERMGGIKRAAATPVDEINGDNNKKTPPPNDEGNESEDDDDSNSYYQLGNAGDGSPPQSLEYPSNSGRRLRSRNRSHPYANSNILVPLPKDGQKSRLTNGSVNNERQNERRRPIANNRKSTPRVKSPEPEEMQVQNEIDQQEQIDDDQFEARRNMLLQNQLLEAQVELTKSQAAYWRTKAEVLRAGIGNPNVVIRMNGVNDDDEEDGE